MKLEAPAAERNRQPIADVLQRHLPAEGLVLELASGTGQHAVYFAGRFPQLTWQPTEIEQERLDSIRAWAEEVDLPNLREPLLLDVGTDHWPVQRADAVLAINLLQVSPPGRAAELFAGAAKALPPGGLCYIYSPLSIEGRHTSAGNAHFDSTLRTRNPDWGVRDATVVTETAKRHGFELIERAAMPANNTSLVFRSAR